MKIEKKYLILSCIFLLVVGKIFLYNSKANCKMVYKISNIQDVVQLFPKTPNEIKQCADRAMKDINAQVEKIIKIQDSERTFDNTMREFDKIAYFTMPVSASIHALENLSPDKAIRDTAHEVSLELSNFLVDKVSLNVDLYKALNAYYMGNSKKENLSTKQKQLNSYILLWKKYYPRNLVQKVI